MKYTKNIKKLFAVLLTIILIVSGFSVSAEESDFTISGESLSAMRMDSISIRFTFSNNPGVSIISLNLDYDPDVLELTEISGNPLMGGSFNGNVDENFIFWMNYTGDVAYNGVAFTAYFDVKDDAKFGETTVSVSPAYTDGSILNNDGDDILPEIFASTVEILGGFEIGDVNCDGEINALDIKNLISIILEINLPTENADVSKDGTIDIVDLIVLKKIIIAS